MTTTTASKNNRFKWSKQQLCTCIMLFSTLLWHLLHDYDVKPPTTTNFPSSFFNLNKILKNSTPGKVACNWHIERVQIHPIKFERKQIHFFSDVFTAAVVVALLKVPIIESLSFTYAANSKCQIQVESVSK